MPLLAIGMSHHTAPLHVRERLAFSGARSLEVLREIRALHGVNEAVLVSTCNRTEVYAMVDPDRRPVIRDWLADTARLDATGSGSHFYTHQNRDAVSHLFQVASGLDSLVLGEPQILGQLKDAWHQAHEAGSLGKVTDRLFQRAFAAGKTVRTETGIGAHPVSVAYIATVLARQIFGTLTTKTVLLVGAGEMINLCGQHFREQGVARLVIANRSADRAAELAQRLDAEAVTLDGLPAALPQADIVVSSTASEAPVITAEAVNRAMKLRRRKLMFLVDIAVPRDIEPAVGDIDDAFLYTIDDLQKVAEENRSERHRAAGEALETVENSVQDFMRWLHGARAADSLQRLRGHAEECGRSLADKALRQLAAGHEPGDVVAQLASTLTHQILHGPTLRLREAAEQEHYEMLKAADWLFDWAPHEEDPQA